MASLFAVSFMRHHARRGRSALWIHEVLKQMRPYEPLTISEVERLMVDPQAPWLVSASAGNDQRGRG